MSTNNETDDAIRNLGLLKVTWKGITFHCTAKTLPSFKDAPTWTISTDNTDEKTGRTITGKPTGLNPIELTIETNATLVYGTLMTAMNEGTQSDATFTYTPRTGASITITVPKCSLIGLVTAGGTNNLAATTIVRLQPEGGMEEDLPSTT